MIAPISPVSVPTFPGSASATQLKVNPGWNVIPDDSDPANVVYVPQFIYFLLDADDAVVIGPRTNNMTKGQWNSWSSGGSDSAYILGCIAANIGVTLS